MGPLKINTRGPFRLEQGWRGEDMGWGWSRAWGSEGWLLLGFPFYVKKLFTRNIVTDVTDGYYVVITVVTT
jgi:hypothetical protein